MYGQPRRFGDRLECHEAGRAISRPCERGLDEGHEAYLLSQEREG